MSETYEVHVSAQHWTEGCDFSIAPHMASACCPVYRAMAEAGLPVAEVFEYGWFDSAKGRHPMPYEAANAVSLFDDYRLGERGILPEPLTFYVELDA